MHLCGGVDDGEVEGDFLAGQALVHTGEGVELVLGGVAVLGVQEDLWERGQISGLKACLGTGFAHIGKKVRPFCAQSPIWRSEVQACEDMLRAFEPRDRM